MENKKRQSDDDEMDRGRQKKIKFNNKTIGRDNPGYNPFTEYQIQTNVINQNNQRFQWISNNIKNATNSKQQQQHPFNNNNNNKHHIYRQNGSHHIRNRRHFNGNRNHRGGRGGGGGAPPYMKQRFSSFHRR